MTHCSERLGSPALVREAAYIEGATMSKKEEYWKRVKDGEDPNSHAMRQLWKEVRSEEIAAEEKRKTVNMVQELLLRASDQIRGSALSSKAKSRDAVKRGCMSTASQSDNHASSTSLAPLGCALAPSDLSGSRVACL